MREILQVTPIEEIRFCEEEYQTWARAARGNRLWIKRDDLLGFSFGGNKVRIMCELFDDMKAKGGDCMIVYGSSRSNLCRVAAQLCRMERVPCYMITAREDQVEGGTFNSHMVEESGARVVVCEKKDIAVTVRGLMDQLRADGLKPYYIYGDCSGRGNEEAAARAYEFAYQEMMSQAEALGIQLQTIALASGTGMTQGGLIRGQQKNTGGVQPDIVGFSVARAGERGLAEVERFAGTAAHAATVHFVDADLLGGYGKYDIAVEQTIHEMMSAHGIPMDPTYTGKAFTALLAWMEREKVVGQNILFIHTGGTPLYFDYVRRKQ